MSDEFPTEAEVDHAVAMAEDAASQRDADEEAVELTTLRAFALDYRGLFAEWLIERAATKTDPALPAETG